MTNPFRCDDKTRLIAYLYGELERAEDRAAIEAHLSKCSACTEELAGLRSVRIELGSWQPPEAELGFRVVREPARMKSRAWWQRHAWAPMALAAGLVLAAGAALANVEVQVANGSITLRAGWSHTAQAAAVPAGPTGPTSPVGVAPAPAGMSKAEVSQALADFETRLRAEIAQSQRQAVPVSTAAGAGEDRQQILQRVSALVDESERRQQRELALRLAQVVQDFDAQRRTDLVRIEQGFGQIESLTGLEAARQRQITNYLVRASQQK
jgi:Putative zinc-finger